MRPTHTPDAVILSSRVEISRDGKRVSFTNSLYGTMGVLRRAWFND